MGCEVFVTLGFGLVQYFAVCTNLLMVDLPVNSLQLIGYDIRTMHDFLFKKIQ